MSSIGTGYDLSASQFSPDGRVFQVKFDLLVCVDLERIFYHLFDTFT